MDILGPASSGEPSFPPISLVLCLRQIHLTPLVDFCSKPGGRAETFLGYLTEVSTWRFVSHYLIFDIPDVPSEE